MSTHFRPRPQPPPTPTSPVRPSTAHSTIRAVTPSPPGSGHETFKSGLPLPRPKSEHALGSPEMAMYARYVLQAENGGFENLPGLRRGGATSGRSSPVKSRSRSPRKRPFSTPPGLSAYVGAPVKEQVQKEGEIVDEQQQPTEQEQVVEEERHQEQIAEQVQVLSTEPGPILVEDSEPGPLLEEDSDSDADPPAPDTPTPMTRAQKRQAYTPLRLPTATNELSFLPPGPPTFTPTAAPNLSPTTPSQSPFPRKPLPSANRISISATSHTTFLSTASKNSIFSTPGRDELERKKALIEVDEGPFARVQSMMDLDEERRRVSTGRMVEDVKDKKERGKLGGCGCVVM
ncbi:hypothetical protein CC86DRAFT_456739 [Ophiobolus disseminans]|uniref:Uncharacterized protein n=1 Tax=Ophiobolus disseminans TaxID=1469910 RepID=A0A6A6ZUF9_9PLEO|nr:hypothetical protein CC86DRAFT_456739 [Ophiobolus disseminans]